MEKSNRAAYIVLAMSTLLVGCGGGIGEALLAKKVWDEIPENKKQALMRKNPFRQQTADTEAGVIRLPDLSAKRLQNLLLSYNCDVGIADGFFGKQSNIGLHDFETANPTFSYPSEASFVEIANNIEVGEWEFCSTEAT